MVDNYENDALIYSFGGAIIWCLHIAVDLYIISDNIDMDDYICGSILLYVDIIRLFIYFLKLVCNRK